MTGSLFRGIIPEKYRYFSGNFRKNSAGNFRTHNPSHSIRGGRSSAAIPEVQIRLDVEFRQETEIENPEEVVITFPITDEKDFGAARELLKNRQKST